MNQCVSQLLIRSTIWCLFWRKQLQHQATIIRRAWTFVLQTPSGQDKFSEIFPLFLKEYIAMESTDIGGISGNPTTKTLSPCRTTGRIHSGWNSGNIYQKGSPPHVSKTIWLAVLIDNEEDRKDALGLGRRWPGEILLVILPTSLITSNQAGMLLMRHPWALITKNLHNKSKSHFRSHILVLGDGRTKEHLQGNTLSTGHKSYWILFNPESINSPFDKARMLNMHGTLKQHVEVLRWF
nr:hypothetical protein Iba_chr07bCG7490 [Ipomoea batatas]